MRLSAPAPPLKWRLRNTVGHNAILLSVDYTDTISTCVVNFLQLRPVIGDRIRIIIHTDPGSGNSPYGSKEIFFLFFLSMF